MGLDDQITVKKHTWALLKEFAIPPMYMYTHLIVPHWRECVSFCSEQRGQTGPHVCLWCSISSRLWGEAGSLFSGPSPLKALVWFLHSQDILEKKLNLSCKTIAEKKRPQQFDVSTPFYCQYFDRFHDSLIICWDPCQGFNCYMRNYTFSCGDVGTKHWLRP